MNQYFLKWQEGVTFFKQEQGVVLLLFAVSIFLILRWAKETDARFAKSAGILGLAVFVPVTAALLLCGYSGFYDWQDLLLAVPLMPVIALGGCLVVENTGGSAPRAEKRGQECLWTVISLLCVLFLSMAATNFHVFDEQEKSDGYGIPAWAGEAFDTLKEAVGDRELQILGDNDLIMYARLYCTDWYPVYGRDLWDTQAMGYVEYDYAEAETQIGSILALDTLSGDNAKILISYVEEIQPDCLIALSSWEEVLSTPADYNLVTLSGQYIAYIKNTPEEET
ncbi:MAG: hypothetical protein LUC90_08470 [Lachnospiraceae bacterium]|nr:hypothetical protein [Lachnospiraceae bacterium]